MSKSTFGRARFVHDGVIYEVNARIQKRADTKDHVHKAREGARLLTRALEEQEAPSLRQLHERLYAVERWMGGRIDDIDGWIDEQQEETQNE